MMRLPCFAALNNMYRAPLVPPPGAPFCLAQAAHIRSKLSPFGAPMVVTHIAVLVLDVVLITFYAYNWISPSEDWQHIEKALGDTYHISQALCDKMNLVISLALVGVMLEFGIACYVVHLDMDGFWQEVMTANAPQLVEEGLDDKTMPLIGVLTIVAIFIVGKIINHGLGFQMFFWIIVPASVGFPQDKMVNYILKCLIVASKSRVEDFRDGTIMGGPLNLRNWINGYMDLREEIGELWLVKFQMLLLSPLAVDSLGAFFLFVLSLDARIAVGYRIVLFGGSLIVAYSLLKKLECLAQITNLCQSTDFLRRGLPARSLPQAAVSAARNAAPAAAGAAAAGPATAGAAAAAAAAPACAHGIAIQFCTHVRNFPISVSFWGGIEVSYTLIISGFKYLALYGSVGAALALRYFFNEHDA